MDILWQQIIIGVVVLAAVGYLVRHYLRRRKAKGCAHCAAKQALLNRPSKPLAEHQKPH